MLGILTLLNLFDAILKTGHLKKIYHSVINQNLTDGTTKPAAPVNGRFVYVGVDDTKGFTSYCRLTGPALFEKFIPVSSQDRLSQFTVPYRIVFFNGSESKNHDELTADLVKAFLSHRFVRVQKINTIAEDILKQEVPAGKFSFTRKTFYIAIDFLLVLQLQAENCEVEILCRDLKNPYSH